MMPDKTTKSTLSAVIANDISAIEGMSVRIEGIARPLDSNRFMEMAGAAYLLHNLYNALENSFEQISRSFENHVKDPVQWHKELLGKMFLDIPGIRPAVLPRELQAILNELRGFRHVFRHSYDYDLDPERLDRVIGRYLAQRESMVVALRAFRDWLLE